MILPLNYFYSSLTKCLKFGMFSVCCHFYFKFKAKCPENVSLFCSISAKYRLLYLSTIAVNVKVLVLRKTKSLRKAGLLKL